MKREELQSLLGEIRGARIGVVGDFCLDVYLLLESSAAETSLETGLTTLPVRSQRYALGGAGNVANNLQAMGVSRVSVFGVTGEDPFGREMRSMFDSHGIDCRGLLVQRERWDTHVYMKPYDREREQHRLDFGTLNDLHPSTGDDLLHRLGARLAELDVVIINQQIVRGIHTPAFREALRALIRTNPTTTFIVDSRHFADDYANARRKLNVREAARLCGKSAGDADAWVSSQIESTARELYARWGSTVFMTAGERGCLVCDEQGFQEVPGLMILSPVDPVGAGDSMLAGISAALAADHAAYRAAEFGNLVAGVTVQKLMQTGTASPEEILDIGSDPDCRYRPDLARQLQRAVYHPGTEIEVVTGLPNRRMFTHAIFDHDGTLSTLRQGWEEIMEPMMVNAIFGHRERESDPALYDHVVSEVRSYIDRTTGMQTLSQMRGLVQMVRQFKCVPEKEIPDEAGFKKVYNDELLRLVNGRIAKLERGELHPVDFTLKKASEFLGALHARGIILYLASGTDHEDLKREAAILGYGHFFSGRIYGAVGGVAKEAKRLVLERILGDIGESGRGQILAFGDGPVEIRETCKRGGYTIGVAGDEIRRHGLAVGKRKRLIEAGADLIIPDFSQMEHLVSMLFA